MKTGTTADERDPLTRRIAQARVLAEVARALTSSLDLQGVLELIIDRGAALLGARRVGVALAVPSEGEIPAFQFVSYHAGTVTTVRFQPRHRADGTIIASVIERRPVWSPDLLVDPAFELSASTRAAVKHEGYRAVLSVPLIAGERALGAVVSYRTDPGPFLDDEIELLQALADQAVIALENARLYREQERRAARLRTLTRLNQLVSSSLDTETVVREIALAAVALVDAPNVTVWIADEETETLRPAMFTNPSFVADFQDRQGRFGGGRGRLGGHAS